MASIHVRQTCLQSHHFELQSLGSRRVRRGSIQVRASENQQHHHRCEQSSSISRRGLSALGLNVIYLFTLETSAVKADTGASGPFNKYIKRKKLDSLDTYIPPVLLSKYQFEDLEAKLLSDKPEYTDSRSFLRRGPASSLRSNIRAVAQYASEGGDGKYASEAVRECIASLEELDSLLLRASRNDSSATIQKMTEKLDAAVAALDKLLTTVPASMLEKGKAIAASYRESTPLSAAPDEADADTKVLESLL
ncbi:hypothetical protein GOP47_0027144 [Adiantum capillus-veneris]|nr:hypothetical protein GOP47_0027144 [Adiantum capillus-veneris]